MGKTKSLSDYIFIKRWKKHSCKLLRTSYPNIPKKDIMKFLDKQIKDNIKNPDCYIDNNYIGRKYNMTLLDIYDWIEITNPICGGHGVFFRNQHVVTNALAQMILKFLSLRKQFKSKLKIYPQDSYEYATYDRKQGSEKQNVNSIYGSFGNTTSFIFNKYTAPSVTGSGQSLISTTCMAFEAFMANNVLFNSLNECMTYMYNIVKEKYAHDLSILPDISLDVVEKRLIDMFYRYNESYYDAIHSYLEMLDQDELNKIYYKNNLYEFSELEPIRNILDDIIIDCESFTDPNDVPESISDHLSKLWSYYKDFVLYNYSPVDRSQRLKNDKRKCVITVDTDSNMLNLNPWVTFMFDKVINVNPKNNGRDEDSLKFIAINTMAYIITNMISTVLWRYCNDAKIPEDFRHYINMKNEFLFTRMILASKKKRYMSSVKLREGKMFDPEIIDIKGLDFMKSTTSEVVKKLYMEMITNRVLHAKNIDLQGLLRDVAAFEEHITQSLRDGEKDYLTPASVKEVASYSDPFRIQGVRAVHAWNIIHPDMTINLPEKVDIVKVLFDNPDNLTKLATENPEIYEKIMKGIVNNPNDKISKKGFVVLAIPKNVPKIPDWVIPYIDYDTISYNVLKKVFPILQSLGFKTLRTSKQEYFSNVVDI